MVELIYHTFKQAEESGALSLSIPVHLPTKSIFKDPPQTSPPPTLHRGEVAGFSREVALNSNLKLNGASRATCAALDEPRGVYVSSVPLGPISQLPF